ILDYSKIEAGRLELEALDFAPRELCEQVVALLQPQAEERGLALATDLASALPPRLRGDHERLRQVLVNLLGNAIKFTAAGQVVLRCQVVGSDARGRARLQFEVEDSGIGMDAATLARLFQPFTQADVSTTRRFGGPGLGLAICKRLVDLMGGSVEVESQPGRGSTFRVQLPFEVVTGPPPAAAAGPALPPVPARPRGRVLVAEDNPVNQLLAVEMLKRLGCRADVVGNGKEAVEALRQLPYDAVFMDCHMPEMDGLEASRRIRTEEAGARHIPIIAFTASALKGERERCLEAGMDDYLSKPLRLVDLAAAVERWLPS
ncbi:MAG TPA: ATP-binding protein, partial [Chloroflexia bacterium]